MIRTIGLLGSLITAGVPSVIESPKLRKIYSQVSLLHKFALTINKYRWQENSPVVESKLKGGKTIEANIGDPVHPQQVRRYGCGMEISSTATDANRGNT